MSKEPLKPGTTVGQIATPMNEANVQRQNTPGTQSYTKQTGSINNAGGAGIEGPGVKNSWKK